MKNIFLYNSQLENYPYPQGHPFNTSRAVRLRKLLLSLGLLSDPEIAEVAFEPADRITLKKFHTAQYLHNLKTSTREKTSAEAINMGINTADCPVFEGMYEHAVLATGATLTGAKLILEGKASVAFNPSGGFHHAHAERASGFCYINDVALACKVLSEQGKKVLYFDVDVHHGDGVAYAFYDTPDVMTISMHQNPKTLFPGTGFEDEIGKDDGLGYCVNIPLPMGTYDRAYMKIFNEIVIPLIRAYKPDVFVFELGADALAGDPLANLSLSNNTYADIIRHLLTYNKPILMTGGGGYNVENTVRAWALGWAVLSGAADNMDMALGGVMLETTDSLSGLRDRTTAIAAHQQEIVTTAADKTIAALKTNLFPLHGLSS